MAKKWYNFFVVTDRPEAPAGAAPKAQPGEGPKRAAELVPEPVPETTFTEPVGDPTVFEEIYAAARIVTPPHGYSILKVAEMLGSEHLRDLAPDVKRKSILVALDAAGVGIDSIVEDAVHRDRALDTYQNVLEKSLSELRTQSEAENRRLEAEIEQQLAQMRSRMQENSRRVQEEEAAFTSWRARKLEEENRIAEAVSHFVSENPISTARTNDPPGR